MASSSFAEKQQAHHHTNGSVAADQSFDAGDLSHHHHNNNHSHSGHHSTPNHHQKSGHSSSLRGTKLARRARSFKDDLMERITQIRTPNSGANLNNSYGSSSSQTRPHSPVVGSSAAHQRHHSAGGSHGVADMASSVAALLSGSPGKPPGSPAPQQHDLGYHVRQVKHALKHLRDVVAKSKLEMLPGNGTVVLDTVNTVLNRLKSMNLNEQSASLISATTQVYLSLGRLIKLCDEVLLMGETVGPLAGGGPTGPSNSHIDEPCAAALSAANVAEVVDQIEAAVDNLVVVASEQMAEEAKSTKRVATGSANLADTSAAQRTSLPDIPLTPCERDNLEKTVSRVAAMRTSHSTESVLCDTNPTPPPKPPLPHRIANPPPLPPKRRSAGHQSAVLHASDPDGGGGSTAMLSGAFDRMSMRSRSPDDNTSILSASSLDSALNQSRDDDELRALVLSSEMSTQPGLTHHSYFADDSRDEFSAVHNALPQPFPLVDVSAMLVAGGAGNQRNSNESGFVSMNSIRGSMLSTTVSAQRRASEHCTTTAMQQQAVGSHTIVASNVTSALKSASCHFTEVARQHTSSGVTFMQHPPFGQHQPDIRNGPFLSASSSTTAISSHHSSSSSVSIMQQHSQHIAASHEHFIRSTTSFDDNANTSSNDPPPALPAKTRQTSSSSICDIIGPSGNLMRSLNGESSTEPIQSNLIEQPPPLPVKKKHIMAYMEMLGNCSQTALTGEFSRHSVHTYNQHHIHLQDQQRQLLHKSYQHQHFRHISHSTTMSLSPLLQQVIIETPTPTNAFVDLTAMSAERPPELPPKRCRVSKTASQKMPTSSGSSPTSPMLSPSEDGPPSNSATLSGDPQSEESTSTSCATAATPETFAADLLEEIDVTKYLVLKKPGEDGPDVHGGYTDALIVHASQAQRHTEHSENFFAEAFITTFRTFITPIELIEKLVHRYTFFCDQLHEQKAAKESFALLVRVVNDLTAPDLRSQHLTILIEFVNKLICAGQLICAKLLREKILDKIALFKQQRWQATNPICPSGRAVVICPHTLLELKSGELAAQMTLLDAELFQKIEIPELLIWAQAQCEERTPNLTKFTEHFNKMSFWVRSQILWQEDPKDRERYLCKFIKVMKHLRKINNYNSYLALLSALNSAPIQRLEWHKTIKESLDDCELFNSSSNYRMYRQVLADASPPCIPYLGLVLQDLTFVHIGNADYLSDGVVNFLKRWLQNNIVENMKRFKRDSAYAFKKNERIINFFDNFENCLDEDALWQISETIKPRGGRKANVTLE